MTPDKKVNKKVDKKVDNELGRQPDPLVAELIAAAKPTTPFAGLRLERGWNRLRAQPQRRSVLWRPLWAWGSLSLLAFMGVASAVYLKQPAPPASPTPTGPIRVHEAAPPAAAPEEPPAPLPVPTPKRTRERPRPRLTSPAPDVSSLARESALLGSAVKALRQQNAAGALALLDDYATSFPQGTLRPEAIITRVDAQLALGNHRQALALLESQRLQSLPRATEMAVIRGELRAEQGGCAKAISDFTQALQAQPDTAWQARALHGRGVCLWRSGLKQRATADLQRYLALEPKGRFAADVRTLLAVP